MIDIHNHIIFGVDDGCKTIEESLALLKNAESDGITGVFCTPHYNKLSRYNKKVDTTTPIFNQLKSACIDLNIKVNLYLGNEVMLVDDMCNLIEKKYVSTMNNTKYILFEFPFNEYPETIYNEVYDLCISGYVPILAHPERYAAVQNNPNLVFKLIDEGCLMQVNTTSLHGGFGSKPKKCADILLSHNMVHFIASDAHNVNRCIKLSDSFKYISENYGIEVANDLFINNPNKIINNSEISNTEHIKVVEKKGILNRFFKK